jgi:hypothetical protein
MQDDVLASFRKLMAEADPAASTRCAPEPDAAEARPDREQGPEGASAPGWSDQASRAAADAPLRDSGHFVDKLASRMAFPGEHDAPPPAEAPFDAPMLLTSPIRSSEEPTEAERRACAALLPAAPPPGPKLCKLLLTEDFQVRGPERSRLPHPVAPLAGVDYAEDSDLALGTELDDDMTPAAAALRDSVGRAVRSALRAEVGEMLGAQGPASAPEPSAEPAPLIDGDGYIDAEMLRRLVAEIVREELRGALGDDISRRIRKLVRLEINRMRQVQALD